VTLVTAHGTHLRSRSRDENDGTASAAPSLLDAVGMDGERRAEIFRRKAALRDELKRRRASHPPDDHHAAGKLISWHVLRAVPWQERPRVSVFWSLDDELDTRPILHCLHWLGAKPLLPRMRGRERPLAFHPWRPDMALRPGPLGVMEPTPDAPEAVPEIVFTPLLGFDRRGHRLGYGAGYYDRTFASLAVAGHRPLRCGVALSIQEVDAVPETPDDIALDMVVTEAGVTRFTA
jgi:5-formyltetrahydrofolate cyclo-ligase